ncbi:MAG: membrane protein insertase YidC, partial [Deltaproteobacteria bacterium]|nr:membrane protein insertase YidC [Deltaproteobacteria bacterium]
MEQVRLLLAIVLSFLVFLVWQFFFTEKKTDQPVEPTKKVEQPKEAPVKKTVIVPEKKLDIEKRLIDEKETAEEDDHKSRFIRVNTPLYSVVVSEKGAAFKSFTLQNYRKEIDKNSELFEMISPDVNSGTVLSGFEQNSIRGLEDRVFTVDSKYDVIGVEAQKREVVFIYQSKDGILVEKKYVFYADSYVIGMMVSIKNGSNAPIKDNIFLSLMNITSDDKRMYGFEGPSAMIGDKIEEVKPKKVKEKNIFSGDLKWVAIQDRYFISSIIPKEPVEATMKLDIDENGVLMNRYVSNEMVIQPGNEKLFEYELYF